jgi:redox-sensitive bicupin YhaK (pirin superfamily)
LDVQLEAHAKMRLDLRDGWTSMLFVLTGSVRVNRTETLKGPVIGLLDKHGDHVLLEAQTDVVILVLSGEPIDEPIVGYGPFVMNSQAQIDQALKDYQSGVFGTM